MSFARTAKTEIMEQPIDDSDDAIAFMSGLFHACGQLTKNNKGLRADLVTDNKGLFSFVSTIIEKLYGQKPELEMCDDYIINRTTYYRIMFPLDISSQVLVDCGIISYNQEGLEINEGIDKNLVADDEGKRNFIKGAFLGCATSSIKLSELGSQTSTTGYHMEFSSHNSKFLEGLEKLLDYFNISAKLVIRKKIYVLYLKDSENIKDLLALVGATESVLDLSDEMAKRVLRNNVNRQVNCINANINKTVEASLRQIEAIKYINHKIGLESLPEDLQEVAVLRLANQQESMEELLRLSTIKLTKSGLNHRFRRIIKIANYLKQGE